MRNDEKKHQKRMLQPTQGGKTEAGDSQRSPRGGSTEEKTLNLKKIGRKHQHKLQKKNLSKEIFTLAKAEKRKKKDQPRRKK